MTTLKLSVGVVLLAFVTFECLVARAKAICDQETIEDCLAPLTSLPQDGRVTDEQFSTACRGLLGATPCLRRAGCPMENPLFAGIWKGLTDGMEYLCGEGREVYIAGHECMVAESYQGPVRACNATYISTVTANVYAFCYATNDFVKCARRNLYASCSTDFARVYLKFFKLFTSPMIAVVDPSCRIDFFGTNTVRLSSRRPRSLHVNAEYSRDALSLVSASDHPDSVFKFILTEPKRLWQAANTEGELEYY